MCCVGRLGVDPKEKQKRKNKKAKSSSAGLPLHDYHTASLQDAPKRKPTGTANRANAQGLKKETKKEIKKKNKKILRRVLTGSGLSAIL